MISVKTVVSLVGSLPITMVIFFTLGFFGGVRIIVVMTYAALAAMANRVASMLIPFVLDSSDTYRQKHNGAVQEDYE